MITLQDIQTARQRITPYVKRTRLERNTSLSRRLGTNVYLKLELFQKTGSFKPRGAFNQILRLDAAQRQTGVVAVSGGNFAQGVAYAAQVLDIPAVICMPDYTPHNYLQATRAYGARIELVPTFPETFEKAQAYVQQGWHFLHAWDDPHQMAGCGTIGLELLEALPEMTDLVVSVGGGGLIAGITVAVKALKPAVRIWSVETEDADTLGQALEAGKVVHVTPNSLAKTLSAPYVAEDTLTLARAHFEEHVLVSDREAFEALLYLMERAKVITELAASCTLAAAQRLAPRFSPDDHVALLLCGGNTSLDNLIAYRQALLDEES
jgi:threonine dehydratase